MEAPPPPPSPSARPPVVSERPLPPRATSAHPNAPGVAHVATARRSPAPPEVSDSASVQPGPVQSAGADEPASVRPSRPAHRPLISARTQSSARPSAQPSDSSETPSLRPSSLPPRPATTHTAARAEQKPSPPSPAVAQVVASGEPTTDVVPALDRTDEASAAAQPDETAPKAVSGAEQPTEAGSPAEAPYTREGASAAQPEQQQEQATARIALETASPEAALSTLADSRAPGAPSSPFAFSKKRGPLFLIAGIAALALALLASRSCASKNSVAPRSSSGLPATSEAAPVLAGQSAAPAVTEAQPSNPLATESAVTQPEAAADAGAPIPTELVPEVEEVKIQVVVKPDGTQFYYKGKIVGRTPFILKQPRDEKRTYEVVKPGYAARRVVVRGNEKMIGFELQQDVPHPDSL